jgi:hypothetical protein
MKLTAAAAGSQESALANASNGSFAGMNESAVKSRAIAAAATG